MRAGPAGVPRTLFERVPIVMSAQMAATRDGGAVIAFSSYDGTPEFPDANFTVLALDSTGCARWRASLRGLFLARPIQPDPRSIVVASGTISGEPLRRRPRPRRVQATRWWSAIPAAAAS